MFKKLATMYGLPSAQPNAAIAAVTNTGEASAAIPSRKHSC